MGSTFSVGENETFTTIQAAMAVAGAGDKIVVSAGTYEGTVTLKDGVTIEGAGEDVVLLEGTIVTPATLSDATVSGLTVSGSDMLLDMRGTTSVTDVVFTDITLSLTDDFARGTDGNGQMPIGNGQSVGYMSINDGGVDADNAGLTFRNVTVSSNDNDSGTLALVYFAVETTGDARMVIDNVTLTGMSTDTLGSQWNMSAGDGAAVDITNSHTEGGGNFYISGFDDVTVTDNVFDGLGIALNGVTNAEVTGNTFQNIDGSIEAGGGQARGLTIEDAWGTDGVSGVTVTGNIFTNITAEEGAIAFQRWTSDDQTANIGRLNDVDIHDNTFTDVDTPIYLNPIHFGDGAALPADFDGDSVLLGTGGPDTLVDDSGGGTAIFGDDDDDTITGGAGDDDIDGGSGTDTVTYDATLTSAMIDEDGAGHFTVAAGGTEGTDTISGVEVIDHGGANNILLVGNGGYASIQAAIDDAVAGDTILIAEDVYDENITIHVGVTLKGLGDVSINPASGTAITIAGDLDGADVTIDGVDVTGGTTGISVATDANAGKLTITDSTVSGHGLYGLFVEGDDPDDDGDAPIVSGITALDIIDSTFSNNGTGGENGAGHIKLFGFAGDALFQDLTIEGGSSGDLEAALPDNAIEIHGYVNNGGAHTNPFPGAPDIGQVVFDGVTVSGSFHKNPVAIFHFTDLDGLVIGDENGGLDVSGATSVWGPLFNLDGIEGDIDTSGYDITFPSTPGIVTELQGEEAGQTASGQTITGTDWDDRLIGKGGSDSLHGGDGDDELYGHDKPDGAEVNDAGNDVLEGGAGIDKIYGGDGDDTVLYTIGDGVDAVVDGGGGNDTLEVSGTAGDDVIDVIADGGAIATLEGMSPTSIESVTLDATQGGIDTLSYAGTTESVAVSLASGTATGFASIAGVENVTGGSGMDFLIGDGGDNVLVGGGGDDILNGGGGVDTADYAGTLSPGDIVFDGTWSIDGGSEGADTLVGIERVTHGGSGAFLLVGAGGYANRAAAEAAMGVDDVLVFASTPGTVTDTDGDANAVKEQAKTGTDVGIDVNATTDGTGGAVTYALTDDAGGRFAIDATTGVVTVADGALLDFESAGSHQITVRATNSLGAHSEQNFTVTVEDVVPIDTGGTKGNDEIRGSGEADDIATGKGHDTVKGGGGDDIIDGGKGNDKINGGAGDDVLIGGPGKDKINGGAGNDTVSYASSSAKVMIDLGKTNQKGGDAQGDQLTKVENVVGSAYNDKLTGNGGDNRLDGKGGKDHLDGKAGTDLLRGGNGKDTFHFAKGYDDDTILDFRNGDTIDISFAGINKFKDLKALMSDDDGDVVIDFGGGDVLTIANTKVADLDKGDFHF